MSFKESNPRSCRLDPPYPLPKRMRNSVRICLTAPSIIPDISPRQYRTAHQSGQHTTLFDMESVNSVMHSDVFKAEEDWTKSQQNNCALSIRK